MLSEKELLLYLERIGYFSQRNGDQDFLQSLRSKGPSLDLLKEVQERQLLTIPYENLSLHWRPLRMDGLNSDEDHESEPLSSSPRFLSPPCGLSKENLVKKLVLQKRGGYCLELNCLLGEALEALGFSVQRVTAKIICEFDLLSERLAQEKSNALSEEDVQKMEVFQQNDDGWETHQMLLVKLESIKRDSESNEVMDLNSQGYLVDVGLAKYSILEPIAFSPSQGQYSRGKGVMGKQFRISESEIKTGRWNVSVQFPGSRIQFPYYTFAASAANPTQVDQIHYYMSMSPSSTSPPEPFTTMPMTSGEDSIGQVTLQGFKLMIEHWRYGESDKERTVEVIELKDEEEQRKCFQQHFGIEGYQKDAVLVKA
ncbi:N-terminal acetyltransferase [Mortierella sp. AD094]|nr:N-terminal acetyltransferase [Mortierella sp. AD094]